MKLILSLVSLLVLFGSYSQTKLSGVWVSNEGEESALKVIEFKSDGEFVVFENNPNDQNHSPEIFNGNYYYEDGKDLLVTITWYGSQAKTTKYSYDIVDGQLELSQIYPDKSSWTFEREVALSEKN